MKRQSASIFLSKTGAALADGEPADAACRHCGAPLSPRDAGTGFCCRGCETAFGIVRGLGLDSYYRRRALNPVERALKPETDRPHEDFSAFVISEEDGSQRLHLMVEGIHCAACVWLIESALARQPNVITARVNMTTRRLVLCWHGSKSDANTLAAFVESLGYRLLPFDPDLMAGATAARERELLRAMAVAGFAASNVMLLSVAVWSGFASTMGTATRELLYWFSALIALPAIVYSGWPFYRSAIGALRLGYANMDVPISLAVILASGMSLYETATGGRYAYFDAAVTLLFILLIGRYLDARARGRARGTAERLVALSGTAATVEEPSGARRMLPPAQLKPGMIVLAMPGERIAADGTVREGASDIDMSLITGETAPGSVTAGSRVFAGTLNLSGFLRIEVLGAGPATLLAEITRLMEIAEQGRARYRAIADRMARIYIPAVHGLAAATFLVWFVVLGAPWQAALLNAVAVLIVTCPCALALAVPVIQVVASSRLFGQGILLKSATALERLASIDTVVFDKTGTLTDGQPVLIRDPATPPHILAAAAALAGASRHPLAQALHRVLPQSKPPAGVTEIPGSGLRVQLADGEIRLGSRRWCGIDAGGGDGPELWFSEPNRPPVRFAFSDRIRSDARDVIADLAERGYGLEMLSGDHAPAAAAVAAAAGIERFRAGCMPADKTARLCELGEAGHRVLMVGDGLNDAPALAAAHVSMSPSSAAEISQTAADIVFQGRRLAPILEAIDVARKAQRLVKQNFAVAILYNAAAVPLAMLGLITPLLAALAMSSSSLLVTINALRLARKAP
ncbi:MAG: heavy metal translocating P-type ATPase metal-binding domain-containing protein [Alphaproteobacteria bacterium]